MAPIAEVLFAFLMISVVRYVRAFSPAVAPRFDVFSEKIVGSWHVGADRGKQTVEEVMRSCGGAVQGIREVPLNQDEGLYLNRAFDGFVFFDCGTFSYGPLELGGKPSNSLSSLSIPSTRCRVQIAGSSAAEDGSSSSSIDIEWSAQKFQKARFKEESTWTSDDFEVRKIEVSPTVHWDKATRCRMPSRDQPWTLQRAKWERHGSLRDDTPIDETEDIVCWMKVLELSAYKETSGGIGVDGDENGLVLSTGALFGDNQVKALLRIHDSRGKLQSVVLQEGVLL